MKGRICTSDQAMSETYYFDSFVSLYDFFRELVEKKKRRHNAGLYAVRFHWFGTDSYLDRLDAGQRTE